jgi:lipopolysaccharide transport system permease protein
MPIGSISTAIDDIHASARRYSLVGMLGWQDVRQRYRRSALGPFWLTISMGIMIGSMGVVFSQLFNSPMTEFFPFLSVGMILWAFVAQILTEGCTGFISAEGIIKQMPIPLFVHIARMIWRNLIILAHNLIIFPIVLIAVGKPVGWIALLSIPGLILLLLNLTWAALVLGILCARYRDLPQIVTSLLQVIYFVTPIMWMPSLLTARSATYLLDYNPFYHMLEVARAPLLGQAPTEMNWIVSLAIALVGWLATLAMYGRYKRRIAYWL